MNTSIQRILANRDWDLIDPSDTPTWQIFLAEVTDLLNQAAGVAEVNDQDLDRAVMGSYCPVLYAACTHHGSERQHRAFEELWHWIYPRVYARIGHAQDAEDVAQKVQIKVYDNLHQVKEPHGLLGWVSVIMRHEIGDYYRRRGKTDQFEQELPDGAADDTDAGDGMDDLTGSNSLLEAELRLAEDDLVRMIYECMPKNQRRRAEVLVALALKGQTVTEVAETLQTTPANVHLMYFRARKDLPKHCRHVIEVLLQYLAPSQRIALMEGDS